MAQSRRVTDYHLTSFASGELSPRLQGRIDSKSYMQGCEVARNMIILPQGGATRRPGFVMAATLKSGTFQAFGFTGTDNVPYEILITAVEILCYDSSGYLEQELVTGWASTNVGEISVVSTENKTRMFHPNAIPQVLTYNPAAAAGSRFSIAAWSPTVTAFGSWVGTSPIVAGGYPACATVYEGRLIIGGADDTPTMYHGSKAGDYDTFEVLDPITDADAYEKLASVPSATKINWLMGMGPLFIGTDAGVATKSSRQELMTSLTSSFTLMASVYAASSQQGFLMGGEVFYIQKGQRKIRTAQYNAQSETYLSPDIIAHAEHITRSKILKTVYIESPESMLWILLDDGNLASMTYEPTNGMIAWTTHETDGAVEDICASEYGDYNRLWIIVNRDSGKFLEYMDELLPQNQDDYNFVDSSMKFVAGDVLDIAEVSAVEIVVAGVSRYAANVTLSSGTVADNDFVRILDTGNTEIDYKIFRVGDWSVGDSSFNLYSVEAIEYYYLSDFTTITGLGTAREVTNQITGLTWLANEEVHYSIDGGDGGTTTVSAAGVADLAYRGNKIMIGLPYNSYISPMNIANAKNEHKRIITITAEFYKSIGGKAGQSLSLVDPIPTMEIVVLDVPPQLNNGAVKIPFRGGSTYNGDIVLLQDRPLPFTILSLIAEIETGE